MTNIALRRITEPTLLAVETSIRSKETTDPYERPAAKTAALPTKVSDMTADAGAFSSVVGATNANFGQHSVLIDDDNDTLQPVSASPSCDACSICGDCCQNADCSSCHNISQESPLHFNNDGPSQSMIPTIIPYYPQSQTPTKNTSCCCGGTSGTTATTTVRYYTPCEIRRHNHAGSAWLVAGDTIYDATYYLSSNTHPGGVESILKRAGGAQDCTRDLAFHSTKGKKMFQKYEIGKVRPCQKKQSSTSCNCSSSCTGSQKCRSQQQHNSRGVHTATTTTTSGGKSRSPHQQQWWSVFLS